MADIPLFPLPLVLLPGGKLTLQIFETRYIDMVGKCLREDVGFGIILIKEGRQVLYNKQQPSPRVADCGTYCMLVDFDQGPDGLLQIVVEGQVKFSLRQQYELPDHLMMGKVIFMPEETEQTVPANKHHLVEILHRLLHHASVKALNLDVNPTSARDVGGRLTELLPCNRGFKQRMLEVKDPLLRLVEIEKQLLRMQ